LGAVHFLLRALKPSQPLHVEIRRLPEGDVHLNVKRDGRLQPLEAVENQRVVQRHTAIAGKSDSPSPQLTAAIQGITINLTWAIAHAIVVSELIPKLKKDPHYLGRAKLVVLDRNGAR
jgi:hypothetical protein